MRNPTMKDLQDRADWGSHTYSEHFKADPRPHKHMAHAVQHLAKHTGQLAAVLDDLDHAVGTMEPAAPLSVTRMETQKRVADVIICALRVANQWALVDPDGPIDAAAAVLARMDSKKMGPPKPARTGATKRATPAKKSARRAKARR